MQFQTLFVALTALASVNAAPTKEAENTERNLASLNLNLLSSVIPNGLGLLVNLGIPTEGITQISSAIESAFSSYESELINALPAGVSLPSPPSPTSIQTTLESSIASVISQYLPKL